MLAHEAYRRLMGWRHRSGRITRNAPKTARDIVLIQLRIKNSGAHRRPNRRAGNE